MGECWLALRGELIFGTLTMLPPDRAEGSPLYDRPDVAKLNQLAV